MISGEKSNTYARLYRFGPFRLDADERLLFHDDALVSLPAKAFDLLLLLVEAAGHLKSREELIETLWPDTIVVENSLSWHVGTVRKILNEKGGDRHYIETVRGHGYRFSAPVKVERVPVARPEGAEAPSVAAGSVRGGIVSETAPTVETSHEGYAEAAPGRDNGGQARVRRVPAGEIATDGQTESVGAGLLARESSSITHPATGVEEEKQESRASPAPRRGCGASLLPPRPFPSRRRKILWAASVAAIIVIAGVLIWRFVPLGNSVSHSATTPVIAVMPFENLSPDPNNAYLVEGIQDTILSKLAGIDALRVISRASTKRYPSHPINLGKIATELGATAIMEGGVQKVADRVLINVQLIDAKTDEHLWAHTYTRPLNDIFAVETQVAAQVATALKTELLPGKAVRLASKPTDDPQAYLLFLKAEYYANRITNNNNIEHPSDAATQAINLYHQAIARDPRFALAWARLSYLESYLYWRKFSPISRNMSDAKRTARRALALAPSLPQAQLAMGYVEYYGRRDYKAALAHFEQARDSQPNDADVIGAIAYIHRRQGNWQKALFGFKQAMVLDPRNPSWSSATGLTLMALRRYQQADQQFDKALSLDPRDYAARTTKLVALLLAGNSPQQVQKVLTENQHDDNGRGLIPAIQFWTAYLAHQPTEALAAIVNVPDWLSAANAAGREPVSLLRARIWSLENNKAQAREAYKKARNMLHIALRKRPKDASLWSFLGLAEVGLGHKQEAIQAGRKAISLVPVSKDALYGPSYLVTLAKIYAQVGESGQAIKLLRRLLEIPAGLFISVPLLERDPAWDSLRKNPAFQKLLKEFANKSPPPIS